jgi:hypothetical protein
MSSGEREAAGKDSGGPLDSSVSSICCSWLLAFVILLPLGSILHIDRYD